MSCLHRRRSPGADRASPRTGTPPPPRAATACRARTHGRAWRAAGGRARPAPARSRGPASRTARLRLLEVGAAHAVERRRVAAGVLAHGADLIGRHVELVAALVLEQQVVALGAADRARDHARVARRRRDGGARRSRPRRGPRRYRAFGASRAGARCTRRRPVRSASATSATRAAAHHRAPFERRHHDADGAGRDHVERRLHAVLVQHLGQPTRAAGAVGREDDPVPVVAQLGQAAGGALGGAG